MSDKVDYPLHWNTSFAVDFLGEVVVWVVLQDAQDLRALVAQVQISFVDSRKTGHVLGAYGLAFRHAGNVGNPCPDVCSVFELSSRSLPAGV